jgi:hypothetical protein
LEVDSLLGHILPEDMLSVSKRNWGFHGEFDRLTFSVLLGGLTSFTTTTGGDSNGLLDSGGGISTNGEGLSTISGGSPDGDSGD